MKLTAIIGGVILLSGLFTSKVMAADRFVTGSISLETPVGMAPQKASENSPTALFSVKLHQVVPHVNLFAGGELNFHQELPFSTENKYRVGAEYELAYGFSLYGYYERRPDLDTNRYMAGVSWGFKSGKF